MAGSSSVQRRLDGQTVSGYLNETVLRVERMSSGSRRSRMSVLFYQARVIERKDAPSFF
jgi:hypothetical protein